MSELENKLDSAVAAPWSLPIGLGRLGLRLVAHAGIDVVFVVVMAVLLVFTLWSQGATLHLLQGSVLYPLGMMGFLLLTRSALWLKRHFRQGNGTLSLQRVFLQTFRDWIPFILISFIYENLRDLTRFFYTHDIAGTLMAWDVKIFGVELTQWSQQFFHPLLTDYMAFAYALYFILPLFIMYLLSYRNQRTVLREVIMALSLTFLIGFLGYVFLPCSPPRFFLEAEYTQPTQLYGLYIFNALQGNWDRLSVIPHGAFPSLHVGISAIALIYAFRFRKASRFDRVVYWIFVPLVVSLWLSTIYLRHHWFVDIIAGWLLAGFACWIAPILVGNWEAFRKKLLTASS